ncbi:hypothetical protein ACPCT9_16205 [Streptomyces koyangensis]|uniref:hypothetical protein n=1 Tax=Streptomyces koyangensis TaxID=188770 RepID=UPI0033859A01
MRRPRAPPTPRPNPPYWTTEPAAGLRLRVTGRPAILQVTRACEAEQAPGGKEFGVTEVYVYRRDWRVKRPPLRYGYDPASP